MTPGAEVTVYYDGDKNDTDTFLLGSRELIDVDESVEVEVFSPQSPMGAAILGQKVGDTVSYRAPNGQHDQGHRPEGQAVQRLSRERRGRFRRFS